MRKAQLTSSPYVKCANPSYILISVGFGFVVGKKCTARTLIHVQIRAGRIVSEDYSLTTRGQFKRNTLTTLMPFNVL